MQAAVSSLLGSHDFRNFCKVRLQAPLPARQAEIPGRHTIWHGCLCLGSMPQKLQPGQAHQPCCCRWTPRTRRPISGARSMLPASSPWKAAAWGGPACWCLRCKAPPSCGTRHAPQSRHRWRGAGQGTQLQPPTSVCLTPSVLPRAGEVHRSRAPHGRARPGAAQHRERPAGRGTHPRKAAIRPGC